MSMTDAQRKAAYADEYVRRWHDAELDQPRIEEVEKVASAIIAHRDTYSAIAAKVNKIPWWLIGLWHYRESGMNFNRHLHNGDSLKRRTVQVPAGRPAAPPANGESYTFEESAIDALTMPGKHFELIETWDVATVFYISEKFNGFGYRTHGGKPSPYLYAGTNQSDETGKYVADGKYVASAHEGQLGICAIMLGLQRLGVTLFEDGPAQHEVLPEMSKETIIYVQSRLRTLGYFEVGNADGRIGNRTRSAVSAFRDEHGLGLSTVIDDDFLAALAKAGPRMVATERALASTSAIAESVPSVAAAAKNKAMSTIVGGGGALTLLINGVVTNLGKAKEMLAPVQDLVASVPAWAWCGAVVVVAAAYWYQSNKTQVEAVDAYRRGEIS